MSEHDAVQSTGATVCGPGRGPDALVVLLDDGTRQELDARQLPVPGPLRVGQRLVLTGGDGQWRAHLPAAEARVH